MIFDAIRQGDEGQVRALLASDPTLSEARTAEGASTVLWAIYTRHPELAPLLLSHRAPDFFEACALGEAPRVAELVSGDSELANEYSGDGFTGLGFACFFGHYDVAALLLGAGANANLAAKNGLGVSPLHSASSSGQLAIVELLLRHSADPNAADPHGMTPLHTAAGNGNRDIIAILLEAGADRTRKSNDGKTPADIARHYNHPDIAAELEA